MTSHLARRNSVPSTPIKVIQPIWDAIIYLSIKTDNPKISDLSSFYNQQNNSLISLVSVISQGFGISDISMDAYQVSPQDIGPPAEFPNTLPKIGTPLWSMLIDMLANLEAWLNTTVSLDIVPKVVLARLYPEFYRLLPFMITATINLVYWKCSEN